MTITTEKLFKTYKQGAASVTAVRNVTLEIPEHKPHRCFSESPPNTRTDGIRVRC